VCLLFQPENVVKTDGVFACSEKDFFPR